MSFKREHKVVMITMIKKFLEKKVDLKFRVILEFWCKIWKGISVLPYQCQPVEIIVDV